MTRSYLVGTFTMYSRVSLIIAHDIHFEVGTFRRPDVFDQLCLRTASNKLRRSPSQDTLYLPQRVRWSGWQDFTNRLAAELGYIPSL